jgi:peptidyl-prolyl cis-trans isomerase C
LGGEKVVNEQLSKMGLSAKDYKEQLKLQLLRDKLVSAIAGDKVKVSEAEARKFYNTHTNQFNEPEQVKARHILIAADRKQVEQDIKKIKPTASQAEIDKQVEATLADKKKKAEQILAEVKLKPADFPRLAEKNSDDTASAKQGGDLGYFSKETMVQPFSEAAFSTKPGQIHDKLVVSPFGYHIVEVLDRKAPRSRSFDEVKTQLITFLENSKRSQTMEEWLQKEKQTAKIDIKPEYDFGKAEAHGPSQAADAKAGKK